MAMSQETNDAEAPEAIKPKRKRAPRKKPNKAAVPAETLTSEDAYRRVEKEAYFLAEKDGFRRDPVTYWLQAEARIADKK